MVDRSDTEPRTIERIDGRIVVTCPDDGVESTVYSGYVLFRDFEDDFIVLEKSNAIEVAQAILREYRVPFCNRVKGAGLADE